MEPIRADRDRRLSSCWVAVIEVEKIGCSNLLKQHSTCYYEQRWITTRTGISLDAAQAAAEQLLEQTLRLFFREVKVVDPELTTDGTACWKPPDMQDKQLAIRSGGELSVH